MIVYPPSPTAMSSARIKARAKAGRGPTKYRQTVQWKQTNVQEGVVVVDENQLSKLIKKEPIEKYYKLDPAPFATGMFASVRRCKSLETGEVFAAKFSSRMRYGEDCTKEIHHEIALLSLCSPSPRIVRLHDVFQTPKEFIIVMEFAPGGDMQTIIDDNLVPYESDVIKFVQHVVEGLVYLHHRKIAHLDIKPQNLVMMGEFPECDIKVCDFEISRVILEGTEIHEVLGTPEYVAPEILHYEPITLAADLWSLGVTTYVLLTGFSPFGGETDQETFLNISRAQVDFPEELFEDVSEEAKDFIRRLLVRKPNSRMTAKECLRHPWLANNRKTPASSSVTKKTSAPGPRSQVESMEPKRAGCQSCPASSNLRKYLSKSREALFEKVISKQKLHQSLVEKDLRKSTLLRRYNKTRRLCESQMSLVSKTRQMAEQQALTRSREKLYGLRCLSKSHEVLNLYKSLVNLRQEEGDEGDEQKDLVETKNKQEEEDVANGNRSDNRRPESGERDGKRPSTPIISQQKKIEELQNPIEDIHRRDVTHFTSSGPDDKDSENNNNKDDSDEERATPCPIRPSLIIGGEVSIDHGPASPTSNTDSLSITSCESEVSEEEVCRVDEDEPRYTVAQLVSAYNMHQEIVTKTSLEVTMTSKGGIDEGGTHKFPTGPNALRLFIPDIDISSRPKRSSGGERNNGKKEIIRSPVVESKTPPLIHLEVESHGDVIEKEGETGGRLLSSRLEAPPPKYLRSIDAKPPVTTNVAKTVELFNNQSAPRPERKSFSSPTTPTAPTQPTRRKSSPPTMKPPF